MADPIDFFYSDGVMTLTNGSAVVTGTFTSWEPGVLPYDIVFANDGQNGASVVLSVESAASMTLAKPWAGPTLTDVPYFILRWIKHTDPRVYGVRVSDYLTRLKAIPENIEEIGAQVVLDAAATAADRVQTGLDVTAAQGHADWSWIQAQASEASRAAAEAAEAVAVSSAALATTEANRASSYVPSTATSLGGRLSLTAGVAVTDADVVSATALYLVPFGTDTTVIYDGSAFVIRQFVAPSLTLTVGQHLADKNYDVFEYWTGSAVAIGTGPAWTSATARGTGAGTTELETYQGRVVNKNSITLWAGSAVVVPARRATFRGSFRTTAAGTTEDSFAARLVSNYYNATPRLLRRTDPAFSWVHSAASWLIANLGNGNNRVRYLHCVAGRSINIQAQSFASNSTATTRVASVGIGLDQSAADSSTVKAPIILSNFNSSGGNARYVGAPGLGYHQFYWLEYGGGADAQTWVGTSSNIISGIFGETLN